MMHMLLTSHHNFSEVLYLSDMHFLYADCMMVIDTLLEDIVVETLHSAL